MSLTQIQVHEQIEESLYVSDVGEDMSGDVSADCSGEIVIGMNSRLVSSFGGVAA